MQQRRQSLPTLPRRCLAGALTAGVATLSACAKGPPAVIPLTLAAPAAAPAPAPPSAPITAPLARAAALPSNPVLIGWATTVTPAARGPRLASLGPGPSPRLETSALPAATVPLARPGVTGPTHSLSGLASYYWQAQQTASGETFDKRSMTAAHRTLPFGTRVRVTDLVSGRSVIVRINDRGPFRPGRIIDLSEAAAEHLGMTRSGIVPVKIEVVRN